MDLDGWRPDPYGLHEERLFAQGEPTPLVRDDGVGSFDASSVGPDGGVVPASSDHSGHTPSGKAPARSWLTAAVSLIAAGVVVGLLGVAGVGSGGSSPTTTAPTPPARALQHLPSTTSESPLEHALRAQPTTTTESPIERELQALPRSTPTEPSTSVARAPAPTVPPSTAASSAPQPLRTQVTKPAVHPVPTTSTSIAVATTLPLTTTTTSVGQADQAWYVSYGAVFTTLQTDIEKLNQALTSTPPNSYSTVIPSWKQLFTDVNHAMTLPSIPDETTQSEWASALGDLSAGASQCIIGSVGITGGGVVAASIPPIFSQGTALITTGTTLLNSAAASVQS
jgi:hypothetical protein